VSQALAGDAGLPRFFEALWSVRSLVRALPAAVRICPLQEGAPLRVAPGAWPPPAEAASLPAALAIGCEAYGMERLVADPLDPAELDSFEVAVSTRLALAPELWTSAPWEGLNARELRQQAEAVAARATATRCGIGDVVAADGALLPSYEAGPADAPAIAIVMPCGMPLELSEGWLTGLGDRHRALTSETRGMLRPGEDLEGLGAELDDQAGDVLALLDARGLERAHIVGLCSGAVVAMRAGLLAPERIHSLSLWHGDFLGLGKDTPHTGYQRSLGALCKMAAHSRDRAAALQRKFAHPTAVAGVDAQNAFLTLLPYATPDLLRAYGRLNSAIVRNDLASWAGNVRQPTLVVTSAADERAHPEGSRRIVEILPHASLHEETSGDHLSVLAPSASQLAMASEFALSHAAPA
jgi:pimeloyl-ACP methyl ester carboxylesterase